MKNQFKPGLNSPEYISLFFEQYMIFFGQNMGNSGPYPPYHSLRPCNPLRDAKFRDAKLCELIVLSLLILKIKFSWDGRAKFLGRTSEKYR